MYKVLVFLNKIKEEEIIDHFSNYTVNYLSNLCGKELRIGKVESNPLLEFKYSHFVELEFNSKEEWEKILGSEKGEELEKDLLEFHKYITIIFINYEHISN